MVYTSADIRAAGGTADGPISRWTLRRWLDLGAFGELAAPTRHGRAHGRRRWTQPYLDRAIFIRACLDEGLALTEIAELEPVRWAEEGRFKLPRAWGVRSIRRLVALAEELKKEGQLSAGEEAAPG